MKLGRLKRKKEGSDKFSREKRKRPLGRSKSDCEVPDGLQPLRDLP